MGKHKLAFVAFDSAKAKHAVAIAADGRDGEVRFKPANDVAAKTAQRARGPALRSEAMPATLYGAAGANNQRLCEPQRRVRILLNEISPEPDAKAVVDAGADELHVHPRDDAGRESLHPRDMAAALQAIRTRVPGLLVGVSTGWWILPDGRARRNHIHAWRVLPDYVSVNLIEEEAPEIIALVLAKGIGVEAGLWSRRDAERFAALADAPRCLRVLIEINEQDLSDGLAVAHDIMAILDRADIRAPRLLHSYEATKWPLYREALRLELDTRIGFEDGALLPSRATARSNADLIRAARALREQPTEVNP